MAKHQKRIGIALLLVITIHFVPVVSEVMENPNLKTSKLHLSLIDGQIRLPYYVPPRTTSRSSSPSIYFPPPGAAPGPQPAYQPNYQNSNYPSRNYSSIPESPSGYPPPRYPQPPRDSNQFPVQPAGGNNRYNSSGSFGSMPSYPSYPSSPSNPSYPNGGSSGNQFQGQSQQPPRGPIGSQQRPSPPGSGRYPPRPSNPANQPASPEDSNRPQGSETSQEEISGETTPGKHSSEKASYSSPSRGNHHSSHSKPSNSGNSFGEGFDPTNASSEPGVIAAEVTEEDGNDSSTITCKSTKVGNLQVIKCLHT